MADFRDPFADVMVKVEGGTFMMGSDDGDEYSIERPAHSVTVSDYSICKYLVTMGIWRMVMNGETCSSEEEFMPVGGVNWYWAKVFIEKLNSLTGKNYRLPTEAEWEFAARGGNKGNGFKYAGGDNYNDVGWFKENADGKTHRVGLKACNELGLYDMSGNMWEWCEDCYDKYTAESQSNPKGPDYDESEAHVLRGGGWYHSAENCKVTCRDFCRAKGSESFFGFRICL